MPTCSLLILCKHQGCIFACDPPLIILSIIIKNLKQQHRKLNERRTDFDMNFKKIAQKLDHKLKVMGIDRPRHGPRIEAPSHSRNKIYSRSSSSVSKKANRQSQKFI